MTLLHTIAANTPVDLTVVIGWDAAKRSRPYVIIEDEVLNEYEAQGGDSLRTRVDEHIVMFEVFATTYSQCDELANSIITQYTGTKLSGTLGSGKLITRGTIRHSHDGWDCVVQISFLIG